MGVDAPHDQEMTTPTSPDEGAELIRAFLRIGQKSVRDEIIELVNGLSEASNQAQQS